MGILGDIAKATQDEAIIRLDGDWAGVEWRIRRVRSQDLIDTGAATVLAAMAPGESKGAPSAADLGRMAQVTGALVCAGVMGARRVGTNLI